MYTNSTTSSAAHSNPIQLRLTPAMAHSLQTAARANGRSLTEEIRHRLERDERVDLQIQGLRAEIALHGAASPRPDDRVFDALQRLQGMTAELLGAMRRYRDVDTTHARAEVERLRLPVWGRRSDDR